MYTICQLVKFGIPRIPAAPFVKLPSLDTYIRFCPESIRMALLFGKNFLFSLNLVVFMISLLFYILSAMTEKHHIEEELRMAAQANRELNSYLALSEKIAEDRERKRIAREIHEIYYGN